MKIKVLVKKITPFFLLDFYHYLLAFIGALIFWFPSKRLIVIGVTGTSGKSTTVDFITRILEEAGNKIVSNSSIRFKVGEKEWPNNLKMGMPGRFFIQKLLRQAINKGCNYAVLEITSEGIKQFRHKFIHFDTAVFTNLSPEHIESHGGFENYRNEKLKLFKATKNIHVVNIDDENAKYFLEVPAQKTIIFGTDYACKINGRQLYKHKEEKEKEEKEQENYSGILQNTRIIAENAQGTSFSVNGIKFSLNLLGDFNIYNALAAIAVGKSYGVSLEICKKVLEKATGIPGRMEVVSKNPLVVVDYAHTPDQLEKVYRTFSNWSGNPKSEIRNPKQILNLKSKILNLICVLGSCGGGRDKWKRPVLGKIAEKYCSQIIITNEDPYDEDPFSIMDEIESGFSQIQNPLGQQDIPKAASQISNNIKIQNPKYEKILDRRKAIKKAILLAKPEDIVIITGKGSEMWMCVENGKKIPWDDRRVVKEELKKNY